MKELLDKNIEYLSQLTKEEADFIIHVLRWDDKQKVAFILAKEMFEGDEDACIQPETE